MSKILLEGIEASVKLYGRYIETYIHDEQHINDSKEKEINLNEEKSDLAYDVSNIWSVIWNQFIGFIKIPFTAINELGKASMNSFRRDFSKTNGTTNYGRKKAFD